jgi:formate dehydrogenase beta subunit
MAGRFKVEIPSASYWGGLIRCQEGCPVHTDARGYVRAIAEGDYRKAYAIARGPNPLASICGRICAAPCEVNCRRGYIDSPVAIRALKRFVCERYGVESRPLFPEGTLLEAVEEVDRTSCNAQLEEIRALLDAFDRRLFAPQAPAAPASRHRVAIIGSGPAGLACAHDLALMGVSPLIFEMEPIAGGLLYLGIPAYRLPKELIRAEIEVIEKLGVEIVCNSRVGRDIAFSDLARDFPAVVIAVGAKYSKGLPLRNSDAEGVIGGVEFLRSVHLKQPFPVGSRVIVIGGGNVAYDVARTVLRQEEYDVARSALRLKGVETVHLCCLESLEEMPADDVEIAEGDEEGVQRHNSVAPHEIHVDGSGRVSAVTFKKVLRVYDEHKRFSPVFDEADRFTLPCDTLILSVGQKVHVDFLSPEADGVRTRPDGSIDHDPETLQARGAQNVFVAGDCAHGTRLMIDAIASGKRAARSVYTFLTGDRLSVEQVEFHMPVGPFWREKDYEKRARVVLPTAEPSERRKRLSSPVELSLSQEAARYEAGRCLDCGVAPIFDSERCIVCGGCADVCPELCLKLVPLSEVEREDGSHLLDGDPSRGEMTVIIKDETHCIRCGLCAERCPNGAITMERFVSSARLAISRR